MKDWIGSFPFLPFLRNWNMAGRIGTDGTILESTVLSSTSSSTWTAATVLWAVTLFVAAGVAEIGGGWLVWHAVRDATPTTATANATANATGSSSSNENAVDATPDDVTPPEATIQSTTTTAHQQQRRRRGSWWWAVCGSLLLVLYGFLPTLQPQTVGAVSSFGRVYAVYGGFFIVGSFLAGWVLDGDRPDRGDVVGGAIALGGVLVVLFWPRPS